MKAVNVDGKIRLCLFAMKLIAAGDELRYDYGEKGLSWRKAYFLFIYIEYNYFN